jgi:dolichyl-phosphate-mannose-protein mannosyltransferase
MAKILFAIAGWLIGYDGHFLFDNIGDSYIENKVPYIGLRSLPATLGALTVPVVFCIMRDSGYGLVACIVASSLMLFGLLYFSIPD